MNRDMNESEVPNPTESESAAEAIIEILSEAQVEAELDEAIIVAKELFEEFTSPLLIQRAAGATSSVVITGSPAGGVDNARSTKGRNILFNLKDAAAALPGPALLSLYHMHGTSGNIAEFAVLGVIYLFGSLRTLSRVLQIPLTKRTAGVLQTMWAIKDDKDRTVSHDGLLEKINLQFEVYRWEKINTEELVSHLESLERIGCIVRHDPNNSIRIQKISWRLIENVKLSY